MTKKIGTLRALGVMIALASAALVPAASAQATAIGASEPSATPNIQPTPESASGCNGYVCISISGTGTTVYSISSTVQNPYGSTYSTTGHVYVNGASVRSYGTHSIPSGHKNTYSWNNPSYTFQIGDQVCVQWTGISGFPCETIKKPTATFFRRVRRWYDFQRRTRI